MEGGGHGALGRRGGEREEERLKLFRDLYTKKEVV
jgi:hypothetical protein